MPFGSGGGGGGAGLPSQWTTDPTSGALLINVPAAGGENAALEIDIPHTGGYATESVYTLLLKENTTNFQLVRLGSTAGAGGYTEMQVLTPDPVSSANLFVASYGIILRNAANAVVWQLLTGGSVLSRGATTGALATTTFVSGTGKQIDTTADRELIVPVTYNPTAGAAATCLVQLSPDNVTYSTLGTETEPAGVVFDGSLHLLRLLIPAAWYIKLTVTNATIGTGTYY